MSFFQNLFQVIIDFHLNNFVVYQMFAKNYMSCLIKPDKKQGILYSKIIDLDFDTKHFMFERYSDMQLYFILKNFPDDTFHYRKN